MYKDKETANSVATKNNGIVQEISLPLLTFYDKKKANNLKNDYETILNLLSSLLSYSLEYDNGQHSQESVENVIKEYEKFISESQAPYIPVDRMDENYSFSAKIKFYACNLLVYSAKYFAQ